MKRFTDAVNGYNKNEVNEFVSEVTKEYENLLNKLKEKDQEIAILKEKSSADEEVEYIIESAKRKATKIINDSLAEAAKTDDEVLALKKQMKMYKARIKQTVKEQLIMVDDLDNIEL